MKITFFMALMLSLITVSARAEGKKLESVTYDCKWTWDDFNATAVDFHERDFKLIASPTGANASYYSVKAADLNNADVMIQVANVFQDFNTESVVNLDFSMRTVPGNTAKGIFGAASFFTPLQKEAYVSIQLENVVHEVRCHVSDIKYAQ